MNKYVCSLLVWSGHTSVSVGGGLLLRGHHHGVGQDADGRAVDHVGGDRGVVGHGVVCDSVMGNWVGDGVMGDWEVCDRVGESMVGQSVVGGVVAGHDPRIGEEADSVVGCVEH